MSKTKYKSKLLCKRQTNAFHILPNEVGPAEIAPSDVGASRELGPPPETK